MAVVDHGGDRSGVCVDVELHGSGIRIERVLPEFGYCSGAVGDLLAAEVIDGAGAGLKGNPLNHDRRIGLRRKYRSRQKDCGLRGRAGRFGRQTDPVTDVTNVPPSETKPLARAGSMYSPVTSPASPSGASPHSRVRSASNRDDTASPVSPTTNERCLERRDNTVFHQYRCTNCEILLVALPVAATVSLAGMTAVVEKSPMSRASRATPGSIAERTLAQQPLQGPLRTLGNGMTHQLSYESLERVGAQFVRQSPMVRRGTPTATPCRLHMER